MDNRHKKIYFPPRAPLQGDVMVSPVEQHIFHKDWIDLWFSVPHRYPSRPTQYDLSCTLHTLAGAVKTTFATARARDLTARGEPPVVLDYAGRTCFHPDAGTLPSFRILTRKTTDPAAVEFLIVPRDRYSLRTLATDRAALLEVNRMLAARYGFSGMPSARTCAGFDEDGEPVGRVWYGPLSMRYLMRDRIRTAVSDLFYDKFCFFQTVFDEIQTFQNGGMSEYAASWLDRVNTIVDEELDRLKSDRRTLEKQKRAIHTFLHNLHHREAMSRMH